MSNAEKKWKRIALILIALVGVALIAGIVSVKTVRNKQYNDRIAIAEKALIEGDYEQAETGYLAAIAINDKKPEAHKGLAYTYALEGKYEEAAEEYDLLFEITGKPEYGEAGEDARNGQTPTDPAVIPVKGITLPQNGENGANSESGDSNGGSSANSANNANNGESGDSNAGRIPTAAELITALDSGNGDEYYGREVTVRGKLMRGSQAYALFNTGDDTAMIYNLYPSLDAGSMYLELIDSGADMNEGVEVEAVVGVRDESWYQPGEVFYCLDLISFKVLEDQ